LVVVVYKIFKPIEKDPDGVELVVMCKGCNHMEIQRIINIEDPVYKCSKCGGKIGNARKCRDCSFEFSYIQLGVEVQNGKGDKRDKSFIYERRMEQCKCPNCNSISTIPITVPYFKKNK